MATSFFYIYVMATSFFYIYVRATSFFYIYIDIYIDNYIDGAERPVVLLNAIFLPALWNHAPRLKTWLKNQFPWLHVGFLSNGDSMVQSRTNIFGRI